MVLVTQGKCTGSTTRRTRAGGVFTFRVVGEALGDASDGGVGGDFTGDNVDEEIKHVGFGDCLGNVGTLEGSTF
jgi:hypothetical protein